MACKSWNHLVNNLQCLTAVTKQTYGFSNQPWQVGNVEVCVVRTGQIFETRIVGFLSTNQPPFEQRQPGRHRGLTLANLAS